LKAKKILGHVITYAHLELDTVERHSLLLECCQTPC
jgi:hypothetical protein